MGLIKDIHHVSLLVEDTGRALAFYRDVLGLAADDSRPELGYPGAWLQVGSRQIHLLQLPDPCEAGDGSGPGGRDRHLALTVSDLDSAARLLEAAGVPFTRSRSGRRALFCRDPDQNAIELLEDPAAGFGRRAQYPS